MWGQNNLGGDVGCLGILQRRMATDGDADWTRHGRMCGAGGENLLMWW